MDSRKQKNPRVSNGMMMKSSLEYSQSCVACPIDVRDTHFRFALLSSSGDQSTERLE